MEFLNIWYVDEDEVEAIWSQISNITEITKSKEHTKSFWASLRAGLSKWKLVSIEGNGELNISQNISITERETISIQRKIVNIIKKLGGDVFPLQSELVKQEITRLVYVSGYFVLDEMFYKRKPEKNILGKVSNIRRAEDLVWHLKFISNYRIPIGFANKRHDITLMKYKIDGKESCMEDVHVDLFADGKKVNTHVRHLTHRIECMKPFYFKVIGWLEWGDENRFYIKPVVIMR